MKEIERLVWALSKVIPSIVVDYSHHINSSSEHHVQEYAELRVNDCLIIADYPSDIVEKLEQMCKDLHVVVEDELSPNFTHEIIERLRNSQSDAEARRIILQTLNS
jgi:tryptophan synthase alpha subunit